MWAAKLSFLRTGGPRLYEKAKPFFIGTVVGYAMGILVGMVIDLIWFPGEGHGFDSFLAAERESGRRTRLRYLCVPDPKRS